MFYGIPMCVLSVASWSHWSIMLLVSYYEHSGCKNAAGWYSMTPYVTKIAPARSLERSTKKALRSLCARVDGRERRV